jgi:phospholipid/cholesterol/gamma-HCH transport system substrate-binding protein
MRFRSVVLRLALFASFTGAVTALLASVIGNVAWFRARYRIEAAFTDATGILPGDPVTVAGVTVGRVRGAHIERGLAVVDLAVDEDVRLPRTTRVEIRYRNLIGLRVVNLLPGEDGPPYLRDGDRVPASQTQGPLDLDAVFNNLRPLLTGLDADDVNTLARAIVVSFAEHKDSIDAVLADLATVTGALAGRREDLAGLVERAGELAGAVADERAELERLLASLARVAEVVAGDSAELDRVLGNLETLTRELGRLVADHRNSLARDLDDLATLLALVVRHQRDLRQVAGHLDDVLAATLRATSYGEWANLYVPAFCLAEIPGCDDAPRPTGPRSVGALLRAGVEE